MKAHELRGRQREGTMARIVAEDLLADNEIEIRDAFAIFDSDGSGTLTAHELASILTQPTEGHRPFTEEEAMSLIRKFDANGDGVLQVDEFIKAFSSLMTFAVGASGGAADSAAAKSRGNNEPMIAHYRQGLKPIDALRLRDNVRRLNTLMKGGSMPVLEVLRDVVGQLSKQLDDASLQQVETMRNDVQELVQQLSGAVTKAAESSRSTQAEKPLQSYRSAQVRSAQEMQRREGTTNQIPLESKLKVRDFKVLLQDVRRLELLYFSN